MRVTEPSDLSKYLLLIFYVIKNKLKHIIAVFLAIFLLFGLNNSHPAAGYVKGALIDGLSTLGDVVSWPFLQVEKVVDEFVKSFQSDELLKLREENLKLINENANLKILAMENEHLKKILEFRRDGNYEIISTSIVKASLDVDKRSFIINAGQQSGVRSGSPVVINNNLVGKVVDVAPYYSVVQIITGRNSKTPVVFIESREKGIVTGSMINADDLTLQYCSNLDNIKEGELLITSGSGTVYPYGIIVGQVYKEGNEFKVTPTFKMNELEFVTVMVEK